MLINNQASFNKFETFLIKDQAGDIQNLFLLSIKNNALSVGLSKQTTAGICYVVNVSKMCHIYMVSFLQRHTNYQNTTRHCFSKQYLIQEYFLSKFWCTTGYLQHQMGLCVSD